MYDGWARFSKSLIQFSVDGWGCVPSLLFDLRPNFCGSNKNNGNLLQKVPCTHCSLSAPNPAAGHCRPTPPPETLGGHKENLVHTRTKEKGTVTHRDWRRLACECPGVSGRGMGRQWPAAGSGALKTMVRPQVLLKEVTIICITPTIVWPQVKQRGGNTAPLINRKLD